MSIWLRTCVAIVTNDSMWWRVMRCVGGSSDEDYQRSSVVFVVWWSRFVAFLRVGKFRIAVYVVVVLCAVGKKCVFMVMGGWTVTSCSWQCCRGELVLVCASGIVAVWIVVSWIWRRRGVLMIILVIPL